MKMQKYFHFDISIDLCAKVFNLLNYIYIFFLLFHLFIFLLNFLRISIQTDRNLANMVQFTIFQVAAIISRY